MSAHLSTTSVVRDVGSAGKLPTLQFPSPRKDSELGRSGNIVRAPECITPRLVKEFGSVGRLVRPGQYQSHRAVNLFGNGGRSVRAGQPQTSSMDNSFGSGGKLVRRGQERILSLVKFGFANKYALRSAVDSKRVLSPPLAKAASRAEHNRRRITAGSIKKAGGEGLI